MLKSSKMVLFPSVSVIKAWVLIEEASKNNFEVPIEGLFVKFN